MQADMRRLVEPSHGNASGDRILHNRAKRERRRDSLFPRNRSGNAWCCRSTAGDETEQRTEGFQRGQSDKVESGHTALEPGAQHRGTVVCIDLLPQRGIDHLEPLNINLISGGQDHVIDDECDAVRKCDFEPRVHRSCCRDRAAFVECDFARDSFFHPGRNCGRQVRAKPSVPGVSRKPAEQIREVLEGPIDPAGRDPRAWSNDPVQEGALAVAIRRKPFDWPP